MSTLAYPIPAEGITYPFVFEYVDRRVNETLADLYFVYNGGSGSVVLLDQLAISTVGDNPVITLQLVDSNAVVVFATATLAAPVQSSWGPWTTTVWDGASAFPGASLKLVFNTANALAISGFTATSMALPIVTHCVDVATPQVTGITFVDSYSGLTNVLDAESLNGLPIVLEAGYNIVLSPTVKNAGSISEIGIAVVPGGGAGLAPAVDCQGPSDVVCTINGQGPDAAGNFVLDPEGCYWMEIVPLPEEQGPGNQLVMHNDCVPCADCVDYYLAYAQLSTIYERALTISTRFIAAVNEYNSINATIGELKTILQQNTIVIIVTPLSQRAVSIAVSLQAGQTSYSSVNATVTYTSVKGGTHKVLTPGVLTGQPIVPIYNVDSGREKLPGLVAIQTDTPFAVGGVAGAGMSYTAAGADPPIGVGTFGQWSWAMLFAPPTDNPTATGSFEVDIAVTVSATPTASGPTLTATKTVNVTIVLPPPATVVSS